MAPSSVSTASTVMEGPVTLPLSKFSYCTSPNPQTTTIWTHLPQRSDMFAVFDVIRRNGIGMVVSEIKVLRLFRGGDLLEQVEFPDLRDQVRLDEECAQHQQISDKDLRVIVMVKGPALALRYALPDGQIRKIQMKFILTSSCDVALETFRTAGLPIRDQNPLQVQAQHPQSSQSQSRPQNRPGAINAGQVPRLQLSQSQPASQERPGSSNAGQSAPPQSLHGASSNASRSLQQERTRVLNTGHVGIPPSAQPTSDNIRPLSAPGGVNQDKFSRPISTSSRPTLDASGSITVVSALPIAAEPRPKPGLLPSPVFNGTYEPFGSSQVRPVSAPEQTQTQRDYSNTLPLSEMLPPERILPFPEKKIHPFRREEAAPQAGSSLEKPGATDIKARKQTKPRAQPAKPRKSRANVGAKTSFPDPLAPSSPFPHSRIGGEAPSFTAPPETLAKVNVPSSSAPPRVPSLKMQAEQPASKPPALPGINSRKRSLTDQSVNHPSKWQARTMSDTTTKTTTETITEDLKADIPERQHQEQLPQATDPFITTTVNTRHQGLLDFNDNKLRQFRDLITPKPGPQTGIDELAEYMAQSDEDRAKALDSFIRECCKNDDFWELMDEFERAWKRIGLGLGL